MSRVLVTGASGFIGQHVLPLLAQDGHEVHALARKAPSVPSSSPRVVWHEADLFAADEVATLLARLRPDRLLHLAWYAKHGRFWTAEENLLWVGATLELLRAFAANGGRRVVIAGTCAEYDWSALAAHGGRCSEERTPLAPSTLYGTAKHAVHLVAERYSAQLGIELAWGRIFFLYGPEEQPGRLVPAVVTSLLAGAETPVSDGAQVRDFMHVADVAGAFATILDSGVTGAVNVASGEGITVKSVIERVAALTGRPELLAWGALPRPSDDPDVLVADVARLRQEAGFVPSVGLDDGLEATVSWWRERLDG